MRISIAIVVALAFSDASAQAVYKCKGVDGKSVYQSFPCAGAMPPEKVWSGNYRQPTNAERWATYNRDQQWKLRQQADRVRRNSGSYYIAPARDSKSQVNSARCSIARSEYDRIQANFKLNRNVTLLRNLEAQIYRYCEVRP